MSQKGERVVSWEEGKRKGSSELRRWERWEDSEVARLER